MQRIAILPTPTGWAAGVVLASPRELLFISGQVPQEDGVALPSDPLAQAQAVYRNIDRQLRAAGFSKEHIAKLTVYLSSREMIQPAYLARSEYLGNDALPAMTIVICELYDKHWLLEVEAIAAR